MFTPQGRCQRERNHEPTEALTHVPKMIHSQQVSDARPLSVVFFRSETGREPVREWLKSLPESERRVIGEDLKTLQFRWPLGMPLVRSLGDSLWELRSNLPNRIARCIFYVPQGRIVLLHGFIKKTQKTPTEDRALALKRKDAHTQSDSH